MAESPDNYHIEEEDDSIYYSAEDEEPDNGEEPDGDSEGGDEEENRDDDGRKGIRNPWHLMFKLICSPVEGWKAIRRSRIPSNTFAWKCFYPSVVVTALSNFASFFYEEECTLGSVLTECIVIFMTFILSNFCVYICSPLLLPRYIREKLNTNFGKIFVMAMLNTLTMAMTLWNLFPPIMPLLVFVPVYTYYLISRGIKYLRVDGPVTNRITIMMSILIIGMPLALYMIFSEFIPK